MATRRRGNPGTRTVAPPAETPTLPGQVLVDDVTVGGSPGSATTGLPPTPGTTYRTKAVATREYVSGQQTVYAYAWIRALTFSIDDITQDLGDDLYDRMLFDESVKAAIITLKSAILSDPMEVVSASVDETNPDHARATEIAACCRRTLDNLATPLDDVLWNMLDALPYGNKVAELIFGDGRGEDAGRLVVTAIKPKKRRVISFVVDVYMNIVGFLALIPGQGFPVQIGIVISEPDRIPNLLPREKFAVLSWRPQDGDPRGTSILRSAYTPWNMKMQLLPEYLRFLSQFASPSLIGFLPDMAMDAIATDPLGNPVLDSGGNPVTIGAAQDMAASLQQFRNGTAAAFPFGAKVEVIEATGSNNGNAFEVAFTRFDDAIARAILSQTLATGEGKHDSRAAAAVHQDILLMLVRQAKQAVCAMIKRDIFTPLVRYNFGEDALPLVPTASLGDVSEPDKATLWTAAAQLETAGYILPSQRREMDVELGIAVASADDYQSLADTHAMGIEGQQVALETAKHPPPPVAPVASTPTNGRTPAGAH